MVQGAPQRAGIAGCCWLVGGAVGSGASADGGGGAAACRHAGGMHGGSGGASVDGGVQACRHAGQVACRKVC